MGKRKDESHWWLTEPLSIVEFSEVFHIEAHGAAGTDPEVMARRMREINATAAHVHPMGCHLNGRKLFFRHNSPGDPSPEFDYLEGWLEHARPAGIRTVVYFNVHSVKAEHARRHPEWQQRREDGSAKEDVYTIESTFCLNGPWRNWVFDRLRELCAYPIDGIFFDGPVIYADCCYCDSCRRLFKERYDLPMPPKRDRRHPDFPKLVAFQSDTMTAFMRKSREVIKSINPDMLFYMNSNPLGPDWATGRNNRKLAEVQDILASEGGFFYGDLLSAEPLWKVGMNAKLLEAEASSANTPTLVFDCVGHKPWTYSMLPPTEVRLMWASSVAHRAGTWLAIMKESVEEPAVDDIAPLYDFARRHRAELFESVSLAEVAVMVSKATMNYYAGADVPLTDFTAASRGAEAGNFRDELTGWYRALWSMQVPFDLVDDYAIEHDDLSPYRLLILPNVACLSSGACAALAEYVRKGGTLVGTFETGLYDEHGRRTSGHRLGETFGIRLAGAEAEGPRQWDYLFRHGGGAWTEHIRSAYIPSPRYALNVEAAEGAEVPLTFSRALPDRYAGLAEDSGRPAMVVNSSGNGKAIYFACDLGAALGTWRLAEHLQIVRDLIEQCAPPTVRIPDAPPSLEVSLRRSADAHEVLLHLVNYTGGMTRPMRRVVPLKDLTVELRVPAAVQSVCTLWSPQEIDFEKRKGLISFVIPVLHEYELVKVRLRSKAGRAMS